MKFLSLYTPSPRTAPPGPEYMAQMGKLIEESMQSGILVATGGLMPIAKGGAWIQRAGDEVTVTDGPFAETKEVSGGFAILEARSREDAIEITRRFLKVAGDGLTELHQIMGPEDVPPSCTDPARAVAVMDT